MRQVGIRERSDLFRVKLFGTPSLIWEGQSLALARKQARALIYLLGTTLEPVARGRLAFLFWPDTPESTARRNLSRVLSYISKTLPDPELLQINRDSITLNPALVWSDSSQFTALKRADIPENQEAMVALYQGSFLSGFDLPRHHEFEIWKSGQQGYFEEQYLNALKNLVQAKFSDQDYEAAIQHAQQYLAVDELAEDVHQQLIRIYAADGDRGAAMRQFEACTVILERELGVEPLPETRAAYDAARAGNAISQPTLTPKPAWTVLPSLDLPLIGRQEAWDELEGAYRKFRHGGVILIHGEAGIGKSRLLQEFATSKDRLVLYGNCHASTQTLPYQPLTQALRQTLPLSGLWEGIQPVWLSETGRLLPELANHFSGLPALIEVEPDQAQARLYEALTQVVLGLARNNSALLLCLDDLQWVDEATAGWLTYLSNRLAGSSLCIVATYRIEEQDAAGELRRTFSRLKLLAEIPLLGLSRRAIEYMLSALPSPPSQLGILAERIRSATGGNSFFVLETIRTLLENDLLDALPLELPLPKTVQSTIQRRLAQLSPVARQLLETAAVLSPDLNFNLLQETAGRSELEAVDGLDELVDHQLLTYDETYHFKHDLIHQVTYLGLSSWRRQLLHRRAADTLSEQYGQKGEEFSAIIAGHYHTGGEFEKAGRYYYQAGIHARALYAYSEAIDYLQKAINLSSERTFDWRELTQYYELLGECLKITGQYEAARQVYSDCLERIPESAYLRRVEIQTKLAAVFENLYLSVQAEQGYDKALQLLSAHLDEQQNLTWQQAWLDIHLERWGLFYTQAETKKMEALQREIKPLIEKVGRPDQRVLYYSNQVSTALRRERYAVSEQTVRIAESRLKAEMETSDPVKIASAKFRWGFVLLWSGGLAGAENPLTEALEKAQETGRLVTQCRCLVYLTCLYRLQGDVNKARMYAADALEIAQQLNSIAYIGAAYGNLAWLDWRDQKIDRAERQAQEGLLVWGDYQFPFKWLAHWVLLAIYLKRDELHQAVESVRVLLDKKQQRLPDEVTVVLEQTVRSWEANRIGSTQKALNQAVELAQQRGYL